ncbi:Protein of unknown function [Pyronema omphalodes CBS 100304]|uniref:Uncharacterized protein n=1 Tax=Pyronema omphalodes (strain CBS 100304) TaxID=1076935 RepID=U4KVG8_PYROM|nr:Protein of unknown function [Pyronema omphalodes CBS 100304]
MPKNKGAPGTRSTRANARDNSLSHSDLEPSQELPSKKRWTGKQKGAQKFTEAD